MSTRPVFFEIGAQTNFSFLEGASHPEEMIRTAENIGLSGLGIADRNSVAGVVRAYALVKETGYQFQPGARLVFADHTPDILAYPQNRQGWAHLCRLLSTGNLRASKGTCLLYEADLMEWGDDMMLALIPDRNILGDAHRHAELAHTLFLLKERFGSKLHLALSAAYDGRDRLVFAAFSALAATHGIPLIATNQPLYHIAARRSLADVVTAIREHVTIAEAGFRLAANTERHLKPPAEMARLFRGYPEAVANSEVFFRQLHFSLKELRHNYPDESIPGETPTESLQRLTWEGAAWRYPHGIPDKVAGLLKYELDLIREKKYEPYFLTVRKIVHHARHKLEILCQGRGSAANSAVCYCLGITEVNPETSTLLFERFISTERDEPPDIDVDFEHERREEVIQFIYDHYGIEHAGLTAAVTSYRARSAGREVAKVFGLSEDVQSALAGTVWGWSTEAFSEKEAAAAGLDMSDPTTKQVLSHATELMEFPRHLTQHVGGFVITHDRLDEVVPIMRTAMEGRYMIEWNKDDLDTVGILKIDILALGMLTCLARAFRLLDEHYGEQVTLSSLNHGKDDAVYDMICRADTIGIFQIESRAQMSMLPRLRPRSLYDLVIEVAIVRPGPIQGNMVHPYLKQREKDPEGKNIIYPKEELRSVLARTLGVPLFQEQAMQIAITAARFKPSEADQLRRSMATFKRTGKVEHFRTKMVEGMVKNGYEKGFAERCFSQIEGFGEYGFPESHAASFALLVFASSWVKTYFPDIFCAALLNSQPMGFYSSGQLVRDAREHGVEVRPVDINHSFQDATLEQAGFDRSAVHRRHGSMRNVIRTQNAVRLGFRLVKGLNDEEMEVLVAKRERGYRSVRDLWLRAGLSRSTMECLADADAFRSIGLDRRQALWAVKALDEKSAAECLPLFAKAGEGDLQAEPDVSLPEMLPGEQVIQDYRSLSLSLKAHPVSFLRKTLSSMAILPNSELETAPVGQTVTIAGLVLVRQRPGSARGVIFMTIEDETGVANAIVWEKVFTDYRPVVMGARLVSIRGRLQRQSGVIHVVADHLENMTPALALLEEPSQENRSRVQRTTEPSTIASSTAAQRQETDRAISRMIAETAKVMPKGRNFH